MTKVVSAAYAIKMDLSNSNRCVEYDWDSHCFLFDHELWNSTIVCSTHIQPLVWLRVLFWPIGKIYRMLKMRAVQSLICLPFSVYRLPFTVHRSLKRMCNSFWVDFLLWCFQVCKSFLILKSPSSSIHVIFFHKNIMTKHKILLNVVPEKKMGEAAITRLSSMYMKVITQK